MDNASLLDLEKRIGELKTLYDNYFAGIERREPLRQREALTAALRRIQVEGGAVSTQLQFRLNNLRARYQTLEAHWNRVVQQIEDGTFRRRKGPGAPAPSAPASAAKPAASAPQPAPGMNEAAMRSLYKSYADARAKSGEQPISYEAMVSSLKKQVPQVIERFKCKSVDFKVGQKDGKVIIRAVPIT